MARKGANKVRLLLENASDVERQVAGIRDGSTLAAVGVEVVFEGSFLHELCTCPQHRRQNPENDKVKQTGRRIARRRMLANQW